MPLFRNAVAGTDIQNYYNQNDVVAFCRGNKVKIASDNTTMKMVIIMIMMTIMMIEMMTMTMMIMMRMIVSLYSAPNVHSKAMLIAHTGSVSLPNGKQRHTHFK